MSGYCKIKGMECEFVLGEKKCLIDRTCKYMNEWLIEHDAKVRADAIDEYKVKCQQKFEDLQFETGRAWFDFDAGIDRCLEILDKVEEELKEQK